MEPNPKRSHSDTLQLCGAFFPVIGGENGDVDESAQPHFLCADITSIGRSDSQDISVQSSLPKMKKIVSRVHAQVLLIKEKSVERLDGAKEKGRFCLVDLNSKTGVYVNSIRRTKHLMEEEDVVVFGARGSERVPIGARFSQPKTDLAFCFRFVEDHRGCTAPVVSRALLKPSKKVKTVETEESAYVMMEQKLELERKEMRIRQLEEEKKMAKEKASKDLQETIHDKEREKQEQALMRESSMAVLRETEKMRESVQCNICLDLFKEPCLLPCKHTFCKNCLEQWFAKGQKNCPSCRKKSRKNQMVRVLALDDVVESVRAALDTHQRLPPSPIKPAVPTIPVQPLQQRPLPLQERPLMLRIPLQTAGVPIPWESGNVNSSIIL